MRISDWSSDVCSSDLHATIALGRWAVDSGRVAMMAGRAAFGLETPCGLVAVEVDRDGGDAPLVSFVSVPSFASHLDRRIEVPGWGEVAYDIAFGGAYYAILPASRLGLSLMDTPVARLVERSEEHTSELQSLMRISYAVFCLKKKNTITQHTKHTHKLLDT